MGVDKEATDIWKFGRSRPDLSFAETLAAPMPDLSADEQAERQRLITEAKRGWFDGAAALAKAFTAKPS